MPYAAGKHRQDTLFSKSSQPDIHIAETGNPIIIGNVSSASLNGERTEEGPEIQL